VKRTRREHVGLVSRFVGYPRSLLNSSGKRSFRLSGRVRATVRRGSSKKVGDFLTAPFTVLRLLTPLRMSYETAKKRAEPYTRIVEELPEMRRDTVGLVQKAVGEKRKAYVLVNNRSVGNAPFTIQALRRCRPLRRERCPFPFWLVLTAGIGPLCPWLVWFWWSSDCHEVVLAAWRPEVTLPPSTGASETPVM
jgi:hypothetical protein